MREATFSNFGAWRIDSVDKSHMTGEGITGVFAVTSMWQSLSVARRAAARRSCNVAMSVASHHTDCTLTLSVGNTRRHPFMQPEKLNHPGNTPTNAACIDIRNSVVPMWRKISTCYSNTVAELVPI